MVSQGRGRGRESTLPAWLTHNPSNHGPTGGPSHQPHHKDSTRDLGRSDSNPVEAGRGRGRGVVRAEPAPSRSNSNNDETMELLLAQARQVQMEQRLRREPKELSEVVGMDGNSDNYSFEEGMERKAWGDREEEARLRLEEENRKREEEEEEQRRLELERVREEERLLHALMEEHDEEYDVDMMDADNDGGRKRGRENDTLFEFETDVEREERLARKKREERRKRLKSIVVEQHEIIDMPRNRQGVIESEMDGPNAPFPNISMPQPRREINDAVPTTTEITRDNCQDDFDIFATDHPTPIPAQSDGRSRAPNATVRSSNVAQECDDAEGYYKATIGELITLPTRRGEGGGDDSDRFARFRVLGIIGKGVFSTVIKVVEENASRDGQVGDRDIAMKIIRNNEVMAKAAAKEMRILRMLCRTNGKKSKKDDEDGSGPGGEEDPAERDRRELENHNIVRLIEVDPSTFTGEAYATPPVEYRSHCIFLFEFLPYNLREVLSKFGKNVGITLTAVRSYARQLLCALGHLERHGIVHADLKPDNILVSANYSTVKLADFGSAFFETDHDNDPTPYLVSRFYRPPEVILGLEYDRMVDLWSTCVTLAELFTGGVLFPGISNNDILLKFMDSLGPFSHKMVRRHAASYTKMGLTPHFEVGVAGGTYRFRRQDMDRVTGQPTVRMINVLPAKPEARLAQVLLRASKVGSGSASERVEVLRFADFLNRCLALDPGRRLSVRDALKHEFFMKKKRKDVSKE